MSESPTPPMFVSCAGHDTDEEARIWSDELPAAGTAAGQAAARVLAVLKKEDPGMVDGDHEVLIYRNPRWREDPDTGDEILDGWDDRGVLRLTVEEDSRIIVLDSVRWDNDVADEEEPDGR